MTRSETAYLQVFALATLICWSPWKLLAYCAPLLVILWFAIAARDGTALRNATLWFAAWAVLVIPRAVINRDFVMHSALLAVFTYSTFAVIFAVPGRRLGNPAVTEGMQRFALAVVAVQALVGTVQAIYGYSLTGSFDLSNGDHVEGTIHLSLAAEHAFSNPMFATNMAYLLILLLPYLILKGKGFLPFLGGSVAFVLAAVVHVLFLFGSSLLAAGGLLFPRMLRRRTGLLALGALVAVPPLAYAFLPVNLGLLPQFYRGMVEGEYPKIKAVERAVTILPQAYPLVPVVGLGPGQFSSRAGLIGTGMFFGGPHNPRPLPFLPQESSGPVREYLLDLYLDTKPYYGSTHQPLFSWLSVYTEFGAPALIAVFASGMVLLIRVVRAARTYEHRVVAGAFSAALLLLLFLGVQENYWEVPQAILPGVLILKALYARVVYARSA